MIVYALSGPSGTGKSTSALSFAYEKNIPAIIDDGLLILYGRKIAGTSAKFEKNYITAVKRATFYFEDHKQEVQEAIKIYNIPKILILGTSPKMVRRICSTLELGEIEHIYDINEVRTSREIKMALYVRLTQGRHVIPVPHIQVEQSFFKRLIKQGMKIFSQKEEIIGETTVVYPDFDSNSIHISKKVLLSIASYESESIAEIKQCHQVNVQMTALPSVEVSLSLHHPVQRPIRDIGEDIQHSIQQAFHNFLHLELHSIHVHFIK
ncbi:hypothetical protein BTR23_19710 [Alkalihalophilus pseudofirmus]|uniref:hypothetical protein n=1 Tax=Alkalihalobacterium alkalinitrilicum TaxID=427920 RepID=UPI00094DD400|nr:hypothetical protein [Alkalihalobacterium alkalinitrilicum]OLO27652.1 hypothetical protein BTR23_19710 [Alkalihalophilus pseudofirmus]